MTVTEAPVDRLESLEAKIDLLTEQMAVLTADARMRERQRQAFGDLTGDLSRVSEGAMDKAIEILGEAERKGYFEFARAATGVADRVVTNFDEDDLEQFGDNIVTILETVREITRPEMLALLARMVDAVKSEQEAVELESADPPSLWALSGQLRDPEVRRGMARALHTLRTVSARTGPQANGLNEITANENTQSEGENR